MPCTLESFFTHIMVIMKTTLGYINICFQEKIIDICMYKVSTYEVNVAKCQTLLKFEAKNNIKN